MKRTHRVDTCDSTRPSRVGDGRTQQCAEQADETSDGHVLNIVSAVMMGGDLSGDCTAEMAYGAVTV
jgi:hypothetical protein